MSYKQIKVRPLTGALGAEIFGVDLSRPIADEVFAEIEKAYAQHSVIFFRNQEITPQEQCDFTARFGELDRPPYLPAISPEYPMVNHIIREADVPSSVRNFADFWHTDRSSQVCPPKGFSLYCLEAPDWGGDTLFASLYLPYETLSDGLKKVCDTLTVLHSPAAMLKRGQQANDAVKVQQFKIDAEALAQTRMEDAEHPLVRVHPQSGRKLLYVNNEVSAQFKGWTYEESRLLLDFLFQRAVHAEFTCRFRWEKGSLALIDNRCVLHYPVNDYTGFRRHMQRVELAGEPTRGTLALELATASAVVALH